MLPLGPVTGVPAGADVVVPTVPSGELVVPVTLGPREDWLDDGGHGLATWWTVTAESNRVGLRLDGPALPRAPEYADAEMPTEGGVTGAIPVPPRWPPGVLPVDQ